jgi:hypothetical protein
MTASEGGRGVGVWIVEPKVKRAGLHRSFGAFSGKREKIPWKFRKFSGLQEDRL